MLKWQEFWRIIVLRRSPGNLDGVKSQGFWPPRIQRCQGNCAMILTLHCLNLLPLFLHLSLALYLTPVSPTGAREVLESALGSNDVSSPEKVSVCWISTASLQSLSMTWKAWREARRMVKDDLTTGCSNNNPNSDDDQRPEGGQRGPDPFTPLLSIKLQNCKPQKLEVWGGIV